MRQKISDGSELILDDSAGIHKKFQIIECIGEGASCIVYNAIFRDEYWLSRNVRIKECFPLSSSHDNRVHTSIIWNDDFAKEEAFKSFDKMYKKQIAFQNNKIFTNSTAKIIDSMYYGNNTKYIVLDYNNAVTFDKITDITLHEIVKIGISLTNLVQKYHNQNFLILDLKPQNFLVIPETTELVYLIDFDSVKHIEEIKSNVCNEISFSNDWAAPELQQLRINKINYCTDIYSIGAIMFEKIYGRKVTPNERRSSYKIDLNNEYLINVNPKVKALLQDLFTRTLTNNTNKRINDCKELLDLLKQIERVADLNSMYLESKLPVQDNLFVGRNKELIEIDKYFQEGKQVVFISGYGGLGKTELAKRYALVNKENYHTIIWLDYNNSIDSMIMDDKYFSISNVSIKDFKSVEEKMKLIKRICDDKTLIILDNYDQIDNSFKNLELLGAKLLVTTRLSLDDLFLSNECITIKLNKLSMKESYEIIKKYYQNEVSKSEEECIEKIIKYVDRHSLLVSLIGKYLKNADILPSELLDILMDQNIGAMNNIDIKHAKDNEIINADIYTHLKSIFQVFNLSSDEKKVLYVMSIFGNVKLSKKDLAIYSGLIKNEKEIVINDLFKYDIKKQFKEFKKQTNINIINQLIEKGWLEYDSKLNMVFCHSVIREIIGNECVFTYDSMPMLKYVMEKIIYKLFYEYVSEENNGDYTGTVMLNSDYPNKDYTNWDYITIQDYKEFILNILMNKKLVVNSTDLEFFAKISRYIGILANEEFQEFYFAILATIRDMDISLQTKIDIFSHGIIPPVVASQIVYYGDDKTNKYNDESYLNTIIEAVLGQGHEFAEAQKSDEVLFNYIKEVILQFYILDELGLLNNLGDESITVYYIRVYIEYIELYEKMKVNNNVDKLSYFLILRERYDVFNYNLNIQMKSYLEEKRTEKETKSLKNNEGKNDLLDEDDDEEVQEIVYDNSAYQNISNEGIDIKIDFLHNVYNYIFELLLSPDVREWYKEEQSDISSENRYYSLLSRIRSDHESIDNIKYDKDYLIAQSFLSKIEYGVSESSMSLQVMFEYYIKRNWYIVFKMLFYYFDEFYNEEEIYKKASAFSTKNNHFQLQSKMLIPEFFDLFGDPEIGTEACRLLSNSFYTEDNYKGDGYLDDDFNLEGYLDYYVSYAKKSHDKKAYSKAINHKRELTDITFLYDQYEESEYECDTEAMWEEIKRIFHEIEDVTDKSEVSGIINEINNNKLISNKYKKRLLSCVEKPITLFEQQIFNDEFKPRYWLYGSNEALNNSLYSYNNYDLNIVEKIICLSEICYQYIIIDNKELLKNYLNELKEVCKNITDYNGKFNYLALIALDGFSKVVVNNQYIWILEELNEILLITESYIAEKYKEFDYYMMQLSYTSIFNTFVYLFYLDQLEGNKNKVKYSKKIEDLNNCFEYITKTWIGENHIVNEFRDANANCEGRLLDGAYTKERKDKYIQMTGLLIDKWKNENHSAEEYQDKFLEIFDDCFPIPEDYITSEELDDYMSQKVSEYYSNMMENIKADRDEGKRKFIKGANGKLIEI